MAVTLNGAVLTATGTTAATPRVLTWTSAVLTAGDVLVCVVAENSDATSMPVPAAPTGGTGLSWTQILDEQNVPGTFCRATAWWTNIPSGQTSTITQSTSGPANVGSAGCLFRLSGANTVTPVGQTAVYQSATVDPTGTLLQLTGTAAGSFIIMGASDWSAGTAALTSTISGVGTSTTDQSFLDSAQFRGVVVHGDQSASTNQGTLDYSAATGKWAAVLFEIKAGAGGAAAVESFIPRRSKLRGPLTRFRAYQPTRRSIVEVEPPGIVALTGDVAATVTESDTVTGLVGAVAAVTATVTETDTVTGSTGGGSLTGSVTATVTAGSTVTAAVGAVGAVSATVVCGSTVTAAVGRVGAVTATVVCGSTVTGSVAGAGSTVTATVTSTSTVTAVVGAVGSVTSTVTAASTVTGVVGAVAAVTATVVCGSTVTGSTVSGLIGTVTATVTAASTVTGVVGKIAAVTATVAAGSTVTPSALVTATVTSTSTVTAVVARTATVTSTVTSTSTVTIAAGSGGAVTATVTSSGTVTATANTYVRPGNITAVARPTAALTVQQTSRGALAASTRPAGAVTSTTRPAGGVTTTDRPAPGITPTT